MEQRRYDDYFRRKQGLSQPHQQQCEFNQDAKSIAFPPLEKTNQRPRLFDQANQKRVQDHLTRTIQSRGVDNCRVNYWYYRDFLQPGDRYRRNYRDERNMIEDERNKECMRMLNSTGPNIGNNSMTNPMYHTIADFRRAEQNDFRHRCCVQRHLEDCPQRFVNPKNLMTCQINRGNENEKNMGLANQTQDLNLNAMKTMKDMQPINEMNTMNMEKTQPQVECQQCPKNECQKVAEAA